MDLQRRLSAASCYAAPPQVATPARRKLLRPSQRNSASLRKLTVTASTTFAMHTKRSRIVASGARHELSPGWLER
jgi:hypothetical protein